MPGPTLISALPIADPLDGTEDVPIVQHGVTKQSKSADFWSGGTLVPTASPFFTGTIGGTADFSAVLSKATGSSTSRTLAARFSDVVNVLDWGAVADCTAVGVGTNNTTAFQNALAYAKAQGKSLYIPAGKYRMVGALAIDVSAYTSILASPPLPSIVGDGSRATILVWDNGVATGLTVTGSWTGSETIGSFSISGLCLYKGDGAGTGLSLNVLVHAHIKDVISLQWNNGCLCVDVLSSEFDNCQFMYNLHGLGATRSTRSEPNAISFLGCEFGGNQNWGLSVKGGSTLTVTGGSIESNGGVGVEANQFGVQVVASATDPQEGSAGATFNSVYFERNAGFGDIYFANSAWNSTLTVVGCTFNRGDPMSTGALGTNCIRLEVFGASAVTRVSLIGNGFKGLGSYTASSARPYIGVVNAGQPLFIYDVGCHYDSSLEAPPSGTFSGFAPLASPAFTGTIAGTADFSAILAKPSGTGAVTRSLAALLADELNVKDFGAVGNGSTDDTAAINAAIAAVPAVGGLVIFPPGTYKITSAISITAASVHLRGAGTHSTQIMQATSTASVFTVSGTDAQIEHILIGYSVTPGTTVVALNTSSTYGRFNHLTVYNVAHGIRASASASCQFFTFITVLTATGSCFWVDGGTDIQISHFLFLPGGSDNTASTWATAGAFRVSGFVEGLVAHAGEVFGGLYSLAMSGTTLARGSCPAFNNFTDVFFDSSASYGVSLSNVMDTEFIGCWIACGRFTGAAQPGVNLSSTSGIRFANCKFIACGSHGMVLSTGATHTSVQTCTFDSNGGYVTAGTAAGVAVAANVNNFTVAGCRFSNGIIAGPVGGTQQNGVVVSSGTSNHYRIESNIFDASLGGAGVVDAGSGTDKQVETAIGNRGAMTATDLTLTTDASQTALAGAWTQTTPAIAPASGTFTTAGATLRYKKIGRTVMFSLHGLITTPGTGSGGVNVVMPFAPAWDSCFAGRETAVTGKVVTGELFISSTTFAINYGDNTSIIAANAAFTINGAYEAAS